MNLLCDNDDIEIYFKLYLLLYAEDTVILPESQEQLQPALNSMYMYLYCQTWKLEVKPTETKVVIFTKKKISWFKPSNKIFTDRSKAVLLLWIFYVFFSVLCLLCLCTRLFICALWSPAGKGLASWLSFVVCNCEFVTFQLVSLVRCGTWLYRFLIFAPLLTFTYNQMVKILLLLIILCI